MTAVVSFGKPTEQRQPLCFEETALPLTLLLRSRPQNRSGVSWSGLVTQIGQCFVFLLLLLVSFHKSMDE